MEVNSERTEYTRHKALDIGIVCKLGAHTILKCNLSLHVRPNSNERDLTMKSVAGRTPAMTPKSYPKIIDPRP
jgi:hypothetical protein